MRQYIFSLLCFFVSLVSSAQAQTDFDMKVGEALNAGHWFALRETYMHGRDSLNPMLKSFAEAMLAYNFNQNEETCRAVDELIREHQAEIGSVNVMSMLYVKSVAQRRMGQYQEAAQTLNAMCRAFEPYVDSVSLAVYRGYGEQCEVLSRYDGVNDVCIEGEEGLASFRLDSVGRPGKLGVSMMVPTKVNGRSQDVVFDTGAGVNIVSEYAAKRLGLDVYEITTQVSGYGTQQGRFAVAKELKMGNVTLRNVPFHVITVSTGIDSVDVYLEHLDMIIGVKVISAVEELHIDFERSVLVLLKRSTVSAVDTLPNMCYASSGLLAVEAEINGVGGGLIHLDTGATGSALTNSYYAQHKDSIDAHCTSEVVRSAGAGGISIENAYCLRNLTVSLGGESHTFPMIHVSTTGGSSVNLGHGNLGMDYFLQFRRVIYNIRNMTLRLFHT